MDEQVKRSVLAEAEMVINGPYHLMTAAPDLLEALYLIRNQAVARWTQEEAVNFIRQTANSAIAKAEGKL